MTTIYEKEKRQAFINRNRWSASPWKVAARSNARPGKVTVTGPKRNSSPRWLG